MEQSDSRHVDASQFVSEECHAHSNAHQELKTFKKCFDICLQFLKMWQENVEYTWEEGI